MDAKYSLLHEIFSSKKFVIERLYKGDENVINDNEYYLYCYAGTDYWGPIGKVFIIQKFELLLLMV